MAQKRCKAKTKCGSQCRNKVAVGSSKYCAIHKGKAPGKKACKKRKR